MPSHFLAAKGCMGRASAVNIFDGMARLFFRIQPPVRLGLPSAVRGMGGGCEGFACCLPVACESKAGERVSIAMRATTAPKNRCATFEILRPSVPDTPGHDPHFATALSSC